jgi:hypothetical protein
MVEAFERMREDVDHERRAAERQWARRAKQIEAVTFNISGRYGDLQGLVPALPSISLLELAPAVGEKVANPRLLSASGTSHSGAIVGAGDRLSNLA